MSMHIPIIQQTQPDLLMHYLSKTGLPKDHRVMATLNLLHADISLETITDNIKLKVEQAETKREFAYVDGMVRLAYSRYTKGVFPIELSRKVTNNVSKNEKAFLVFNRHRFPMATIMSKIFSPKDDRYFINQIFDVQDEWYIKEKKIQEVSRWAAHPVYDIYFLKEPKKKALEAVLEYVTTKYAKSDIRTVGVFSDHVVSFIRKNKIAILTKMHVKKKQSSIREHLEANYSVYWKFGNPHLYEVNHCV